MRPPIIVTGVPRSRTSMTCGVLCNLGAYGGDMRGPNTYNQKGMWENRKIVQLVKDYLRCIDCDPLAQYPLPKKDDLKPWSSLRVSVERTMIEDGYKKGPWFFKTIKGCHLWECFHGAFPEALWVIVNRRRSGLVDSLLRTPFMRAYNDKEGWNYYIDVHQERFEEIRNNCQYVDVDTDAIVQGDFTSLQRAAKIGGLIWDDRIVQEFVSPELTNGHS